MTVGIIGFGQFGQFFAGVLAKKGARVVVCDQNHELKAEAQSMGLTWGNLAEVASMPVVIPAVPLTALSQLLPSLVSVLGSETLIWDVCSVKTGPIAIAEMFFQGQILATHPVFGPNSAKNGTKGHRMVVCLPISNLKAALEVLNFCDKVLGLEVILMPAEEHDREMARVQGLTHFIARALKEMSVSSSRVGTCAYEALVQVVEMVGGDSWELFRTIQLGNPFVSGVRQQFMGELVKLEIELKESV